MTAVVLSGRGAKAGWMAAAVVLSRTETAAHTGAAMLASSAAAAAIALRLTPLRTVWTASGGVLAFSC
jgi:hypothetical protein